jgi:glycosyltransferase involved in cell wall biosynthesis
MRVALTASLVSPIREAAANGPHSVIVDLARGLAGRGHEVTIYAAAGSCVPGAEVVEIAVEPLAAAAAIRADGTKDPAAQAALRRGFEGMFEELRRHGTDVVSQHAFDAPPFEIVRGLPVIHTLHLPPMDVDVVAAAGTSRDCLVTVSEAAARLWRAAGVASLDVIRNGVPEAAVGTPDREPFALVAGRVSPEKGTDAAIRVARAAGLPVRVVGDIYDRDYYEREVAPLLPVGDKIRPLPRAQLSELMGHAAVTIMPIAWEEAFGLVAAEAQMTGCPVVGYRRGALPEVVVDGVTGYLVEPDDEAALSRAVAAARELDRAAIASDARARLGLEPMVDAYEALLLRASGSGDDRASRGSGALAQVQRQIEDRLEQHEQSYERDLLAHDDHDERAENDRQVQDEQPSVRLEHLGCGRRSAEFATADEIDEEARAVADEQEQSDQQHILTVHA